MKYAWMLVHGLHTYSAALLPKGIIKCRSSSGDHFKIKAVDTQIEKHPLQRALGPSCGPERGAQHAASASALPLLWEFFLHLTLLIFSPITSVGPQNRPESPERFA